MKCVRCFYRWFRVLTAALLLDAGTSALLHSAGMSTSAGEVLLTGLQIGQSYKLSTLAGFKLSCQNNSDYPMNISLTVSQPSEPSLKKGFGPIPDANWIELEQTQFEAVPSKRPVFSELIITIPKNKKYRGKSYQFHVEMEGAPTERRPGFGQVAVALRSRFLITIASSESEVAPGVGQGAYRIQLEPSKVFLGVLEPGKVYSLAKDLKQEMKLVNRNGIPLKIKLESLTPSQAGTDKTPEYPDEPPPHFLTFSHNALTVPADGEAIVAPYLWLPEEEDVIGKRYMFILRATTQDVSVPFSADTQIYVGVSKDKE